ncbi:hypothetical protein IEQ34_001073 [Dendrobium chrysotoxum]|uniref:PIR2-like helical domain-containing protein n=1 Tax=Dendrobium chrysotoxum TaxID=161865 RepID=A0AAV7H5V8_DENCH|nr:hypothetical protein IEQ34_001073 [Dendrobium chrysotoxum]
MGRKVSKKPLRAGATGGKRNVPLAAAVPMHPSDSGILKLPPGTFPTPVNLSDPTRVAAFANSSLKHNLGLWFNPGPSLYNYGSDENGCGNFSEEQLEEIVINYLDCIYKEVISRLVSFGYDAALALRAVLCNGHCYGAVDALSNIMQNALAYLNTVAANTADDWNAPAGAFSDLRHLEEYSLAVMVCLLQQIRADLSRGEAMCYLLMSRLRVRRASSIKFPSLSHPGNLQAASTAGAFTPGAALPFAVSGDSEPSSVYAAAAHPLESMKRFDSAPSLNFFPKQNITNKCFSELKMQDSRRQQEVEEEAEDLVQLVLKRLEVMRIEDEKREDKELQDQKTEMIMDLIRQIRKLVDQVKATKQWAQQKVMQAVQKLGSNTHELTVLRVEREENQRAVNEIQVLEDSTMERRAEMESVLKKASKYVDRVSALVKKLETGNSDIRAEIEAAKVSESLSLTACSELIKRETKSLKKLVACKKEKKKMQEEITEKREKIVPVQQQLAEVQEATKQAEVSMEFEKMLLKSVLFCQVITIFKFLTLILQM